MFVVLGGNHLWMHLRANLTVMLIKIHRILTNIPVVSLGSLLLELEDVSIVCLSFSSFFLLPWFQPCNVKSSCHIYL